MSGTRDGAIRAHAARLGITPEEYERRTRAGLKWCTACKLWHPRAAFGRDTTRPDGLHAACKASRRRKAHERVKRKRVRGRSYTPPRSGDRRQARRRVNYLVAAGLLANPNDRPCVDCGHTGSDRRHEYDHHQGYEARYHEEVEPVCSICHHARTNARSQGDG